MPNETVADQVVASAAADLRSDAEAAVKKDVTKAKVDAESLLARLKAELAKVDAEVHADAKSFITWLKSEL